ncbi:fumarylacetoacetate hydrolase family protein [Caulobacter soli]|uniref:fumarylacetoacetate hydrolase family protein n=1 Tax=Caulobacter soli TaxID=2708539 RepID=UPI0013ECC870|nr:fumarylacetoacetate hydrolase family protein [Caulobacter soli]
MKLVRFSHQGRTAIGALIEEGIVDLQQADASLPASLEALLRAGPAALDQARRAVAAAKARIPLGEAKLLAPIVAPRKFLGIGFNYSSHVDEVRAKGLPIPDLSNQIWFNKQVSCISGPTDPIHLPQQSDELDYEGEMAIVIGRRCRRVPKDQARSVIAGYMICNDVSVRDWQLKAPTATLGKSFDTHGPIGPWLTTADEVADPENLSIKTWVDDELRQNGNTRELVNRIDDMIVYLTSVFTLEPGDILSTGSPAGVGAGQKPPNYLKVGQTVKIEIEGLGQIANTVVAEPLDETTFIQ